MALVLHFGLSKLFKEPFPSFVFPAFARVAPITGLYHTDVMEVYALDDRGDSVVLNKRHVFGKAKLIYAPTIFKTLMRKEQAIRARPRDPTLENMRRERAQFLKMTRAHLKTLYPQKNFLMLVVVVGRKRHDARSGLTDGGLHDQQITRIPLL